MPFADFPIRIHRGLRFGLVTRRWAIVIAVLWIAVSTIGSFRPTTSAARPISTHDDDLTFFRIKVLPILREHCFRCHGGEAKVEASLLLTERQGVLDGGDSGPAVDPDEPASGPLMQAIRYERHEMPPEGKLSNEKIATLEEWIRRSVPYEGNFSR